MSTADNARISAGYEKRRCHEASFKSKGRREGDCKFPLAKPMGPFRIVSLALLKIVLANYLLQTPLREFKFHPSSSYILRPSIKEGLSIYGGVVNCDGIGHTKG